MSTAQHTIVKLAKYTDKENPENGQGQNVLNLQGWRHRASIRLCSLKFGTQRGCGKNIPWVKWEKYAAICFNQQGCHSEIEGEIKSFPDKQKLEAFTKTKAAL